MNAKLILNIMIVRSEVTHEHTHVTSSVPMHCKAHVLWHRCMRGLHEQRDYSNSSLRGHEPWHREAPCVCTFPYMRLLMIMMVSSLLSIVDHYTGG